MMGVFIVKKFKKVCTDYRHAIPLIVYGIIYMMYGAIGAHLLPA